jgi:PAS domain S-box-containing protein
MKERGAIEAAAIGWRQEIASSILWMITVLGLLLSLSLVPLMIERGAWGSLAVSLIQSSSNALMAKMTQWPLGLRAGWLVGNFLVAGLLSAMPGNDRGIMAAFILGAGFTSAVLLGLRATLVVIGIITLSFSLVSWGAAEGMFPPSEVAIDHDTPMGWAVLGIVLALVLTVAVVASELGFRRARKLLVEQQLAMAAKDESMRALVLEQEERQRALEARQRAEADREALLRSLDQTLAGVGAGFWEVDLRTRAGRWSDTMFRLLGYEPGSVEPNNENWQARIVPEDYARTMAKPLVEGLFSEYRAKMPDGTLRWLRSVMQVQPDEQGVPVVLRGIVTDITNERATKRQFARLAEVASRTGNGVVVTDLEGRIEWINDAFARMTGWTLDEVRGRKPGAFLQGPHTDLETVRRISESLKRREAFEVELLNYRKDGVQYWIHFECRLALDEEGQPAGFVAIETDITERRLANRRDHLAQRVAAQLLSCSSIGEAAPLVVGELVAELDIGIAQLWLVEPGNPNLVYVAGAVEPELGEHGEEFLARSRELAFSAGTEFVAGVGVPGMAWGTKRPAILREIAPQGDKHGQSRRAQVALRAGLQTFCATPILGPDGVLGVFEIAGTAYYPGHENIPTLLERVSEQVASFLRHEQSRRAFEVVFQHSPDGLVLVGDDGIVQRSNARSEMLFGKVEGRPVGAIIDAGELLLGDDSTVEAATGRLLNRKAFGIVEDFSAEISVARSAIGAAQGAIISIRDLTERHRMEEALTRSLREKEMLLKEVHHRVKNNLQIVASLLTLQAEGLDGPAHAALVDTVYRVRSMSAVHQQLYGTLGLDRIDLGEYTHQLCTSLQSSIAPDAAVSFSLEVVEVSIENAVPCGLILNELITNALKHGRSSDGTCYISVTLSRRGEGFCLVLADRGPGIAAEKASPTSLGMQLIRSLSRQLRGKLKFESDGGARISLDVPGPL